ncbi:hypothetical protein SAMN05660359_03442 [Geodermatophilus obscurus]|jgi:hypothetical protein|uniref:Uncharacterized protein n=1 Tax=Geodermatophilus obscurus TaxID=1861 RepID=A0A1I5H554_9ACTN|nr:hypothetical protein [Geodermatophilus obscurus]SFO43329.1 hypothetical protein SAMN05660359_03442 [Geodermatophilus obscurus]
MSGRTATRTPRTGTAIAVLRLAGAALLAAIAVIHVHLWQQGYSGIDVIGPAFLVQSVLGFGGALLLLGAPPRLVPWAAALGAAFAAGSLAALLLSTTVGLFGFVETTLATLWWESFWVEAAAVVVLLVLAVLTARRAGR